MRERLLSRRDMVIGGIGVVSGLIGGALSAEWIATQKMNYIDNKYSRRLSEDELDIVTTIRKEDQNHNFIVQFQRNQKPLVVVEEK